VPFFFAASWECVRCPAFAEKLNLIVPTVAVGQVYAASGWKQLECLRV
jgi:hypothetical protein